MKISNFKNRKTLFLIVIIVAVVAVGLYWRQSNTKSTSNSTTQPATYQSANVTQAEDWQTESITQLEKDAGVLAKFRHPKINATLLLRSVEGETDANLDLEKTADAVAESLSEQLEEFKLNQQTYPKVNDVKTIRLDYKETRGTQTYQNVMVIIPAESKIYYLIYSIQGDSISKIKTDIEQINKDIVKYLRDNHDLVST